jgi:hypothetical protein
MGWLIDLAPGYCLKTPLPGLQSNTCPNEPEPYSASLGLNCWEAFFSLNYHRGYIHP